MADDQDDLAAEWGLALAEQGATPKGGMPDTDRAAQPSPAPRAATTWPPNGRR